MVVGRGGEGGRTSQPVVSLSISPLSSSSLFFFLPLIFFFSSSPDKRNGKVMGVGVVVGHEARCDKIQYNLLCAGYKLFRF
jgi:hypothetical protein